MLERVKDTAGMTSLLELLEDGCAAYRLTRLVTTDLGPPPLAAARNATRAAITRRAGEQWAELVDCPWCAGVYVGAAVTLARLVAPRLWGPAARALALAAIAGRLTADE